MRATHTATSAGPTDGGAGGAGPRRPGSAGLGSRSVPLQPSQGMQRQRSRDGMGSPGRDVGIRGDEYGDGYGFSGGGFSDVTSFDERSSMGANNRKDKGKKGGKVKRRETPRKPSDRAAVHLHRHEYVVTKKPKFTSAPFAMSFLERLRWFTEEKLKKRREIQDKFVAIEMAANEERLQQLRLIKDREEEGSTQYLDAEFVPYPGAVPPHKIRNIWLEQGIQMPWGGRFHASPQANSGKPEERSSVLNLFDFALSDRRSANMPDDSEAEER
ncbi:hypothetical protein DFJ73DRAFT_279088 [Zopfochytrium polystomum]|nr:hypothetical protein DFJ73DRAFT_279088 [Zopfochytrium polystomum]